MSKELMGILEKELQETLKVFQAKVFGLLLIDNNSAEDFRKVRALAIGDIKKAIQEHYLGMLPSEEKENDLCKCEFPFEMINEKLYLLWCRKCNKQLSGRSWNACRAEMERKIRGDV